MPRTSPRVIPMPGAMLTPPLGNLDFAFLKDLGDASLQLPGYKGDFALSIPVLAFAAYQMMFAVITPALITGATADRLKFSAYAVFIGLWLILRDVDAVRRARLMGNPMIVHILVIGSGLWIHGGSADGAMAAVVSGVFSALYVRLHQRWHGYIRKNVWYPGVLRAAISPP